MDKAKALGRVARVARIKGFSLTGEEQVELAEFCGKYPNGDKLIVDVANLLRRKPQGFSGSDVLAMVKFLV